MWTWIADNSVTIIALAAVLLILGAAILTLVHDHKKGVSSCGCSCADCPMAGKCHGGSPAGKGNTVKSCCCNAGSETDCRSGANRT